jgi:uncharacterized protein (TIGR03435 family)
MIVISGTKLRALTAAALLFAPAVRAQSPRGVASPPRFDAASIKRIDPGTPPPRFDRARDLDPRQHGRYTRRYTTLKSLLANAYHLPDTRVIGPAWMESEHYTMAAIMPPETPDAQVMLMLQDLLRERFQLKFHVEEKETAVYALMVGKNGPKFNKGVEGRGPAISFGLSSLEAVNMPMENFTVFLSRWLDCPLIDLTGLSGGYDFKLDWSDYRSDPAADHSAALDAGPINSMELVSADQTAILRSFARVGLRAEKRKIALKFLIVDHAEKVPIEN